MYDAILLVSFGGPEGPDDVWPFLDNVLRGRPVPAARKREVAHHYARFGGLSPINAQNRALIAALRAELDGCGVRMPIYWGNRNWHPLLPDTVRLMARDGIRSALAFVTSAYSSYSGCRQYLEDLARARVAVGPEAPAIDKLPVFYDHPGWIAANAARLAEAMAMLPPARRPRPSVIFTAHSIPVAMAEACDYEAQLGATCRRVTAATPVVEWQLVYQSRSGTPSQPWLGPDIGDHLAALAARGVRDVVVAPVGFVSDHLEVRYDLDVQAREQAEALGLGFLRAATAGTHPAFVRMVRELIEERLAVVGRRPPGAVFRSRDCTPDCCAPAARALTG